MRIITAKIIDSTHLELTQPITAEPGQYIELSIPDSPDDDQAWREAATRHFLDAYDDQDAVYDSL